MDSQLALVLLVVGIVRATLVPSHWARSFAAAITAVIAYPVVLALAAIVSPAIRAQWTGVPFQRFFPTFVLAVVAVGVGSFGSHLTWRARRQVLEARRLGSYRLVSRI